MKKKRYKKSVRELALTLSCCLHALLLLGAYYLPIKRRTDASSGYSVTLYHACSHQESIANDMKNHRPIDEPFSAKDNKEEKSIAVDGAKKKIHENAAPQLQDALDNDMPMEQTETLAQDLPQVNVVNHPNPKEETTIDQRSLYKVRQNSQAGTWLELPGWVWDTVPEPKDNSDESGKIVFQITIDEFGEVITVKTLEKTISPLVEVIYKEALTKLTFSKTDDTLTYASTSTGKVTFILQVK